MKHRQNILSYGLAIFLIAGILIFYFTGYIPILGKMIAQSKVNSYNETTYGRTQNISLTFDYYNFSAYNGNGYRYDIRSNILFDSVFMEEATSKNNELCERILATTPSDLSFNDYHITEFVNGSNFSKRYHHIQIYSLYNTESISAVESFKRPAEIIIDFIHKMGSDFNVTGVYLNYYDTNGYYIVSVPYAEKRKITYDILLVNTKKQRNDRLPSDYIAWKDCMLNEHLGMSETRI